MLNKSSLPLMMRLSLPVVVFFTTLLLTYSYNRGVLLEKAVTAEDMGFSTPKLKYNDHIPTFRLEDTQDNLHSSEDLIGSWSLMVFTSPGCSACKSQLQALRTNSPSTNLKLLAFVSAAPLFSSLKESYKQIARDMNLGYPIIVDNNSALLKQVAGSRRRFPLSVLLNPSGHVRYVIEGYRSDFNNNVQDIIESERKTINTKGSSIHLTGQVHQHGMSYPFKQLVAKGWTVLTFAKYGCAPCNERVRLLSRFADAPSMKTYLVFETEQGIEKEEVLLRGSSIQCVWSGYEEQPKMLKSLGNYSVPRTYIFHNGRVIYSDQGAASESLLWTLLGKATEFRDTTNSSTW